MRTTTRILSILTCVLLVTSLIGCGGGGGGADALPLGKVSGIAFVNGKPYADLMVIFQPERGKAGVGVTDAQGKYSAVYGESAGAPVGECTVSFQWAATAPEGVTIPEGWGGDSEVKVQINAGNNTYDFDLK